jgi:hypothetical protein
MQKPELNSLSKSVAEARRLGHNLYFTGVACKHGHLTYRYVSDRICAACAKEKVKKAAINGGSARRWAKKTAEQLALIYAKRKLYYEQTKQQRLEERKRSYEKLKQDPVWVEAKNKYAQKRRLFIGVRTDKTNPEYRITYRQSDTGRGKIAAARTKRELSKIQRTPSWVDSDERWMIEQAYTLAALRKKMFGFDWHVDHVLPLQGKYVSGLHTITNLQVIPAVENIQKSNRYMPK